MKKFRTSNIDFVAYLSYINIKYISLEITKKGKVMFNYDYDFNKLIDLQNLFFVDMLTINLNEYMENRKRIVDIVKINLKR